MVKKIIVRSFNWQGKHIDTETVLDVRAAAETMTAARQGIAASAEAMTEDYAAFSVANDAALTAMADQHDDMLDWKWSVGDLGL